MTSMEGTSPLGPPGPRDHLVTRRIRALLDAAGSDLVPEFEDVDGAEGPVRLARHIAEILRRELEEIGDDQAAAETQAELVNELLSEASEQERLVLPPRVLAYLAKGRQGLDAASPRAPLPATPFSISDLLVNAEGQPNIGSELRAELASADHVDLVCAFVIWSGVVRLRDALEGVVERGGRIRVITTTYMGATQPPAIDELVRLGAEVKVAFDARTTKLHAKAWLLERTSGLTTAFVGSSNLSYTALFDGLEWNLRLSAMDAPHVIARVRAMFESHWYSEHFERYDPESDREKLLRALGDYRERELGTSISFAGLDVRPYPHQQLILDRLRVERERHGRHRNLVVAATGTGKTVVAALDYRALCEQSGRRLSLLFVAHRERILDQSRAMFRHVMREGSFGEIHGGGQVAAGPQVFAMIQSLSRETIEQTAPDAFEVVVIDEFHHAAASTYRAVLKHFQPGELVGLTATPERMDAQDVTEWFDGRIAYELRLWEAIDEGFLVPFQYFGVADGTDLSSLTWRRGGYASEELDNLLTGNDARVAKLLTAIERVIAEPVRMRALGFCVSVTHARYMARKFSEAGMPSVAIEGATPEGERQRALQDLATGKLRCVFSVEVLGEGVDVPAVDTVLLLRPTDSATVFTQQLGRGLRHSENKAYLTVIDLIGQQHREFRFDRRLRALLDPRRGPMAKQVEQGFPFLPSGCHLELDRQSREVILDSLRAATRLTRWPTLVRDLRALGDVDLETFLEQTDREPLDLYRGPERCWTRLRREAGLPSESAGEDEPHLLRAVPRLLHVDDPERVRVNSDILTADQPPQMARAEERLRRLVLMFHFDLWGLRRSFPSLDASLQAIWPHRVVRAEIVELLAVLDARCEALTRPSRLDPSVPLAVHARYTRDEALAAFGSGATDRPPQLREGVRHVSEASADLFFVTLNKSEREYSPTTMYRDYAITPELFHWESQATHGSETPTIRRYVEHRERGVSINLFVRDSKRGEARLTPPYVYLGPARYVAHEGERPVAFTWHLESPIPEELFERSRSVAVA
jgi:superfamily II DNA or RNA helicase/HKD family nuclease